RSHKLARARVRDARLKPSSFDWARDDPERSGPQRAEGSESAAPALPAPVSVTAHAIDIVETRGDTVTLRVECSAGFYVRSLAADLGERLGVGAHLASLRRTRSGDFGLERAIDLDTAERHPDQAAKAVVPLRDLLPGFPAFSLSSAGIKRAMNGCVLGPRDSVTGESRIPNPEALTRLLDPAGDLVGIGRPSASSPGFLHPAVVLI